MVEPIVQTSMNPQLRSGLTAVATGLAAATSAVMWVQSNSEQIYAFLNSINTLVTQIIALVTTISMLGTMALSIWNSRPSKKIADALKSGKVEGVVVNDPALASKLGPEVQTSIGQLPISAQTSLGSAKAP